MRLQLVGVVGYGGVLPVVAFLLARLFAHEYPPDAPTGMTLAGLGGFARP
jgi:hypothetical protein